MTALWSRRLFAAAILLTLAAPAAAQNAPVRVRGTIERVDGPTLIVKTRDGDSVTVKLADNVVVAAIVKRSLTDIKPGDYVGTAATPQAGGVLRALEVHIFPEAMRGTGEGHRGWDLLPESSMTNATVSDMVTKVDGHTLTLKYKDGSQTVVVPPDTPIVTYVPGDKGELKPGAEIFVASAMRAADGSLLAARIAVGRGVAPPM